MSMMALIYLVSHVFMNDLNLFQQSCNPCMLKKTNKQRQRIPQLHPFLNTFNYFLTYIQ